MLQVMWLVLTNQRALFQRRVVMQLWNLLLLLAPELFRGWDWERERDCEVVASQRNLIFPAGIYFHSDDEKNGIFCFSQMCLWQNMKRMYSKKVDCN